jgi:hypothetical protein
MVRFSEPEWFGKGEAGDQDPAALNLKVENDYA